MLHQSPLCFECPVCLCNVLTCFTKLSCSGLLAVAAGQWLIEVLCVLQFQPRGRHDYAGGDQR